MLKRRFSPSRMMSSSWTANFSESSLEGGSQDAQSRKQGDDLGASSMADLSTDCLQPALSQDPSRILGGPNAESQGPWPEHYFGTPLLDDSAHVAHDMSERGPMREAALPPMLCTYKCINLKHTAVTGLSGSHEQSMHIPMLSGMAHALLCRFTSHGMCTSPIRSSTTGRGLQTWRLTCSWHRTWACMCC